MKPTILIADDVEVERKILIDSFRRLAPGEFDFLEHDQAATLLDRVVDVRPDLLVLDRRFWEGQEKKTAESQEAVSLALRIRKEHPDLDEMAILVYSQWWETDEDAARFSDDHKAQRIWARKKNRKHQLLIEHVRSILFPS